MGEPAHCSSGFARSTHLPVWALIKLVSSGLLLHTAILSQYSEPTKCIMLCRYITRMEGQNWQNKINRTHSKYNLLESDTAWASYRLNTSTWFNVIQETFLCPPLFSIAANLPCVTDPMYEIPCLTPWLKLYFLSAKVDMTSWCVLRIILNHDDYMRIKDIPELRWAYVKIRVFCFYLNWILYTLRYLSLMSR